MRLTLNIGVIAIVSGCNGYVYVSPEDTGSEIQENLVDDTGSQANTDDTSTGDETGNDTGSGTDTGWNEETGGETGTDDTAGGDTGGDSGGTDTSGSEDTGSSGGTDTGSSDTSTDDTGSSEDSGSADTGSVSDTGSADTGAGGDSGTGDTGTVDDTGSESGTDTGSGSSGGEDTGSGSSGSEDTGTAEADPTVFVDVTALNVLSTFTDSWEGVDARILDVTSAGSLDYDPTDAVDEMVYTGGYQVFEMGGLDDAVYTLNIVSSLETDGATEVTSNSATWKWMELTAICDADGDSLPDNEFCTAEYDDAGTAWVEWNLRVELLCGGTVLVAAGDTASAYTDDCPEDTGADTGGDTGVADTGDSGTDDTGTEDTGTVADTGDSGTGDTGGDSGVDTGSEPVDTGADPAADHDGDGIVDSEDPFWTNDLGGLDLDGDGVYETPDGNDDAVCVYGPAGFTDTPWMVGDLVVQGSWTTGTFYSLDTGNPDVVLSQGYDFDEDGVNDSWCLPLLDALTSSSSGSTTSATMRFVSVESVTSTDATAVAVDTTDSCDWVVADMSVCSSASPDALCSSSPVNSVRLDDCDGDGYGDTLGYVISVTFDWSTMAIVP